MGIIVQFPEGQRPAHRTTCDPKEFVESARVIILPVVRNERGDNSTDDLTPPPKRRRRRSCKS